MLNLYVIIDIVNKEGLVMVREIIEKMNEKKICMIEANFGKSCFQFDISHQSVMYVEDEHNNMIVVALGQQIVYSVDLDGLNIEIAENDGCVQIKFKEGREIIGEITFRFSE